MLPHCDSSQELNNFHHAVFKKFIKKPESIATSGQYVVLVFKLLMTLWDMLRYFSNILAMNAFCLVLFPYNISRKEIIFFLD